MGAPFDTGTWTGVTEAYYTGMGSGESLWLWVSVAMCVVALVVGHVHESRAYKNADRR
ncbi:MAG: hypothetical protein KTR33_11645 [Gammaproteobacteria bacterium]|nr:hypothetical protein [Gammaproteobacteria bacterium]